MSELTSIEVDEFLPHPPRKVWRVLTEPALLDAWLMPNDGFAAVVGTRFVFRAQPVPATNFSGLIECEVLEVLPERLLRISWSSAGTSLDSQVSWRLVPEGRGTRMLLSHTGFDLDDPDQAHAFDIMSGGWRSHVLRRMVSMLQELTPPR